MRNSRKESINQTEISWNSTRAKTQNATNTLNMLSYDLEVELAKGVLTLTEALEAREATARGISEN